MNGSKVVTVGGENFKKYRLCLGCDTVNDQNKSYAGNNNFSYPDPKVWDERGCFSFHNDQV
jgi:hypothetical protein